MPKKDLTSVTRRNAKQPRTLAATDNRPIAETQTTQPVALLDDVAANRDKILASPSYRLAEYDVDFIGRRENRPLRMQLELLKTETLLHEHHI